ncbi:MAG: LamG domain-containing protein, partial [Sedimentisphaerales bacterium]|nr:LamG domain-containing protein [Sedimentisphaerales bacterium]
MQGPKRLTTILLTLALAAGTASADRVHHWRLDETTGDTACNSAGFQDGQLQNSPIWQPAQGLDGALQCDQDDDGVALGTIDLSSSFTIMGWSRPVPQSARWGRFVNSSHMTGCYLGFKPVDDDNYWHLLVQLAGPIGGNITGPLVTYNTWQHVAAVYNRTTLQATLYVNGSAYGPVTASPPSQPIAATYLGKDKTVSPAILGLYDDVAIFDSALTAAQIQAVYAEGLTGHAINYWQASNPSPADNASDVPLDAPLAWSAGANPPQPITAHILYYGA